MIGGCGGGGGGGEPNPSTPVIAKAGAPNGDGQAGTVAQPLADSFRVVVTEGGAGKGGITVNWTSTAPGGLMSPSSSVTDANGRAASRMTLGQFAGAQTARAGITGSAVTFNASGNAGPAAQLEVFSGDEQAALANSPLTAPLRVKVSDQFDNPIIGSIVGWSIAGGTGNLSGASSQTVANGIASISLTAGGAVGPIQVRAVSVGQDTVIFNLHVVTLVKDVLVKNNFFESVANGSQAPSVAPFLPGKRFAGCGRAPKWNTTSSLRDRHYSRESAVRSGHPSPTGRSESRRRGPMITTATCTRAWTEQSWWSERISDFTFQISNWY